MPYHFISASWPKTRPQTAGSQPAIVEQCLFAAPLVEGAERRNSQMMGNRRHDRIGRHLDAVERHHVGDDRRRAGRRRHGRNSGKGRQRRYRTGGGGGGSGGGAGCGAGGACRLGIGRCTGGVDRPGPDRVEWPPAAPAAVVTPGRRRRDGSGGPARVGGVGSSGDGAGLVGRGGGGGGSGAERRRAAGAEAGRRRDQRGAQVPVLLRSRP